MKLYRTSEYWLVEHANTVVRLSRFDVDAWLDSENPVAYVHHLVRTLAPAHVPVPSSPLMPIGTQEIWAAGVTYQRSKVARMEESVAAKSAYDLVYDAPRPEIFFKGNPRRCRSTGEPMRLRDDSKWMVPEPELALVISSRGQIVGYTIGNDLSCRDIEGENLLYLPQAKTWDGSCSLGPAILLADPADDIRSSPSAAKSSETTNKSSPARLSSPRSSAPWRNWSATSSATKPSPRASSSSPAPASSPPTTSP